MSEPSSNNQAPAAATPAATPEPAPEKTFTQADVDSAVGKAIARIKKGMPAEEELTAFRAWKESQQTEKERWDTLTTERDAARTELTAAQAKIEQYEREKFLLGKGVPAGDVDYYAFKIGKLVSDTVDFEKAAEQYLKDHAPRANEEPSGIMRVSTGGPLGEGPASMSLNDQINRRLRGL